MLYITNIIGLGVSIISIISACILCIYMRRSIKDDTMTLAANSHFYQDKIDELKSAIRKDTCRYKIFQYIEWSLYVTNSVLGIILTTNFVCNHVDSNIIGLSGLFVVLANVLQILITPNKVKYYYRLRIIHQQKTLRQCEEYTASVAKSSILNKDLQSKIVHLVNECFNTLDALEMNNI